MSAEHKSYIECDAIMQDKKLSALLGIPELSDEEKELADVYKRQYLPCFIIWIFADVVFTERSLLYAA